MSVMRPGVARATEALLRNAISVRGESKLRVSIDSLDGSGSHDYSAAVLPDAAVRIERGLNVPSRCTFDILLVQGGLPLPARRGRIVVSDDASLVLFTGYLATEPVRDNAGGCSDTAAYRAKVSAVSDEWLLDKLGPANENAGFALQLDVYQTLERLLQSVGGDLAGISVATPGVALQTLGALNLSRVSTWSEGAGLAAGAGYAAYRAIGRQAVLQPAGTVVHALSDVDGLLAVGDFKTENLRELANDITITGEEEPATYVTEIFQGDGTTSEYILSEAAFRGMNRALLSDAFTSAAVDSTQWSLHDPGSHVSITSAGLTMSGGNGIDGGTTLAALNAMELGGSMLIELHGVQLAANSDGLLGGIYEGPVLLAACFAGFRVRQNAGATVVVPVVSGVEVGSVFTLVVGHSYTLRLRLHCGEVQRVMQRYTCMVDGVVQTFGDASGVNAPMDLVFELVDEGASSNTPSTVLYDSAAAGCAVALTPATGVFVAANSARLFGSVASVAVTRPGTLWVESTLPSGATQTRLIGAAGEGADCQASYGGATASGKLSFFAGRVPVAGELVRVRYRTGQRALARLADEASVAAENAAGVPGTSRWLGKVLQPPARSSADCETAAQAILSFSTSRTAAVAGTYTCVNPAQDVWPGDLLEITSAGVTTSLLVRRVKIEFFRALPGAKRYTIEFANDWATQLADGLGLRLSEAIASDALLPQAANGKVLSNLGSLQVLGVSGTALDIDAGTDPLAGGGFEVRRRENGFRAGSDGDLVLRSPVRNFTIPRGAQVERYYVRMFDASVPPKYSRFANAVFLDVPVE